MRGEGVHACAAHLHPSFYLAARFCLGTATQTRTIACTLQTHVVFFIHVSAVLDQVRHTQTRTIACTHLHAYYGAHKHGMHALSRTPTPALRPRHLPRPSPLRRRRAVAASAPPQHARTWRQRASWFLRTGEQACGQRRGHSDKSGLGRRRRSPAQGTLHSGHAPAQAHCNRGSHGRPPVLCTLHANACAHGPDGKAFTYPSMRVSTSHV